MDAMGCGVVKLLTMLCADNEEKPPESIGKDSPSENEKLNTYQKNLRLLAS